MWAYGVVLWEIGTLGGFPYAGAGDSELAALLDGGHRLARPLPASTAFYALMLRSPSCLLLSAF